MGICEWLMINYWYIYHSKHFCRSDAIYSALYDGTNMIEIIRGHEYLSHPFAVSLYGSEVYWTDWRTNTLSKANKWTGQNVSVIQKTSAQPFDLQIYHPSRQPQGKYLWHKYPESIFMLIIECVNSKITSLSEQLLIFLYIVWERWFQPLF
jgi:hypothetical protein